MSFSPAVAAPAAAGAGAGAIAATGAGVAVSPSVFSGFPALAPAAAVISPSAVLLEFTPKTQLLTTVFATPFGQLSADVEKDFVHPASCMDIAIPDEASFLAECPRTADGAATPFAAKSFGMTGDDDAPMTGTTVTMAVTAAPAPAAAAAATTVLKPELQELIRKECELAMPGFFMLSQNFIREMWLEHVRRESSKWTDRQASWARRPCQVLAVEPTVDNTEAIRAELCATVIRAVTTFASSVDASILATAHADFIEPLVIKALAKPETRLSTFIDSAVAAIVAAMKNSAPDAESNATLNVMGACFSTLAVVVKVTSAISA